MKPVKNRERVVWVTVTVVLLAALALLTLSPRLLAGSQEDETQAYLSTFGEVFRFVRDNYVFADKATPRNLLDGALKGMFEALGDPHSAYLKSDEWRSLTDTSSGTFGGVGLNITKLEGVGAEVVSPIEGTPAYKAGISAGDAVIKVDGVDIKDFTIDQIVDRLRGEPQSSVTVTIKRGESVVFDVALMRDNIEVPTVKYAMLPKGVGYLRIIQFTPQTAERCRDAIRSFESAGYASMVVDVRGNGGGLLSAVVEVANLFISEGTIVSTRSERVASENYVFTARRSRMMVDPGLPIVLLVDKGSASASEILAGALKDTGRALLVGATTYGKGSVQQVKGLGDGGFRLTMSLYHTPSGAMIDKKGIDPDRKIEEPQFTAEEEKSLNELLNGTYLKGFVKANPQPTEAQISQFIADLHKKGIVIKDRYLRRLVRNEVNRTNNNPPIFDLDFDIQLQAALKALASGDAAPHAPGAKTTQGSGNGGDAALP